jgi:hypothetical protein
MERIAKQIQNEQINMSPKYFIDTTSGPKTRSQMPDYLPREPRGFLSPGNATAWNYSCLKIIPECHARKSSTDDIIVAVVPRSKPQASRHLIARSSPQNTAR